MSLDQKQLTQIDHWLAVGDPRKAENQLARLLRQENSAAERAQLLLRRARSRLMMERANEALEDVQDARTLIPTLGERPDVLELAGDAYFASFELSAVGFAEREDANAARTCYEHIVETTPTYENLGWVLYQWGRVLLSEDRVDGALEKFTEALLKPSVIPRLTALIYERLGFIHLIEKRDPAAALSFFSRAATLYPKGDPTGWLMRLHLLRSRAYKEQGSYDEALRAAETAMNSVDPSEPDYRAAMRDGHLTLGEILADIPSREREAIEHLNQFLQQSKRPLGVDVTWSRIHEILGNLYFQIERYEQAVSAYRTALGYNPYHPWEIEVQYQIARCYYRLREYEKTVTAIQRLQELAKKEQQPITDYRVYGVLGNAHFALEQYADAVTAFRQALSLAPDDAPNVSKYKSYLKAAEEITSRGGA